MPSPPPGHPRPRTHPRPPSRRRRPSDRRARTAVAALLLLSAVAYTAWVLEVVLSTGLDPVQAYISELAAEDQPLGGLFRATDLVAGLCVLAAAVTALATGQARNAVAPARRATDPGQDRSAPGQDRSAPGQDRSAPGQGRSAPGQDPADPGRNRWALVGWSALALFGAATAADSRLPLSCAPTSDEMCAARETAGLVPATHTAHAVTSSLAMLGALTGLVALTVLARRNHRWPAVRRLGPWLLGAELLATGWSLGAIAAFQAGRGTWALGAGQRVQVLLVALWLAVLAVAVARSSAPRALPTPDTPAAQAAPTAPEAADRHGPTAGRRPA